MSALSRYDKLSPAVIAIVVEGLKACHPFGVACARAGISRETGHRWLREAKKRDADPLVQEFRREVIAARYEADATIFNVMREKALEGDWRCASRLYEMLHPRVNQRTARVDGKIEHTFSWSKLMEGARDNDDVPEQIEAGEEWIAVAEPPEEDEP